MKPNLKKIIYSMHPLQRKIIPYVSLGNIEDIVKKTGLEESIVKTGVQLLEHDGFANFEIIENEYIQLDKFGLKFIGDDLPEIKFLKKIVNGPKSQLELGLSPEEFSSAIGFLKRNSLINVERNNNELYFSINEKGVDYLSKNLKNPLEEFKEPILINNLSEKQKGILDLFKQRKGFLKKVIKKSFFTSLTEEGKKVADEINLNYNNLDLIETLTSDMLKSKSYRGKEFRHYDISVKTSFLDMGRRHPMIEANNILRDIFIEMGFKEMEGPMVESAFWNMDSMWIPQDHPARDEQDTFYLEGDCKIPHEFIDGVKEMHEEGIKYSHTPKGEFSINISKKKLLRTHSTATTFRTLAELGKKQKNGEDIDGMYFYVANNFRNEAIDATHLAEFFQAEGFIIADDLSLADLMGFVKVFYKKLGIDKIKFKPTFNPYTEPSMEAHFYDPKLDKWYALINSGIFRPETLKPFGLENKTIIAWGMGASRLATLLTGAKSMRDITGFTCDFEWLRTRPQMKRKIVRD